MFSRVINPYMVFQPVFHDDFSKRVHREFQAPKLSLPNKKTHKQEMARKETSKSLASSDDEYEIVDPIAVKDARKDTSDVDEDTVLV